MKGTAAVLWSCLKLLSLVDAISLAKVSVSKYQVGWEKVESEWLPDGQQDIFVENSPFSNNYPRNLPAQFAKNNVLYNTRRPSTNDLPYSKGVDGLYRRPDLELAPSYVYDTPSQNLMPQKYSVDNLQRNSVNNDPYYIKMKLKFKMKIPLADRLGETVVSEPNYVTVTDNELRPSQLSNEYPENTPTATTPDPFIESLDRIYHAAKNLPETVEHEAGKNVENLQHSSRVPNRVQEIATKPAESNILQQSRAETTPIDAYLNYLNKLHLSQLSNEYPENTTTATTPDPFIESLDRIYHAAKNLPETLEHHESGKNVEKLQHSSRDPSRVQEIATKPTDVNILQESRPVEDDPIPETTLIDAYLNYLNKLQQLLDTLNEFQKNPVSTNHDESSIESTEINSQLSEHLSDDQMELSEPDDFESKSTQQELDPHVKLYDAVHRESKIPLQVTGHPQTVKQLSKDMPEDQTKLSDPYNFENKPAKEDPHAKLYDDIHRASKISQRTFENSQMTSKLSKDKPQDQMKLSDPYNFENKPAKEDPHAKLYDDIHRASKISQYTFGNSQMTSQLSKDIPEDQTKLSDPYNVENKPAKEDPHAKLYDDIHRASKISQYTFGNSQMTSQLSKDIPEDQMKLDDPDDFKSEPAKEDDPTELYYDTYYSTPKIPQHPFVKPQTISQSSNDNVEESVELLNIDDYKFENEPAKEDPQVILINNEHNFSKILSQVFDDSLTTGQLSEDLPEYQMKLSDPDDFESSSEKGDPQVKFDGNDHEVSKIPSHHHDTRDSDLPPYRPEDGFTESDEWNSKRLEWWPSTETTEGANEDTSSKPNKGFFTRFLSWFGKESR